MDGLSAALNEAMNPAPVTVERVPCKVCKFLAGLDSEDALSLEQALASLSAERVRRVLLDHGFPVAASTLRLHVKDCQV